MITEDDIQNLSRDDKLRMMELLWSDLTSAGDSGVESPSWHERVLNETARRFRAGEEEPVEWTEAKARLRSSRG